MPRPQLGFESSRLSSRPSEDALAPAGDLVSRWEAERDARQEARRVALAAEGFEQLDERQVSAKVHSRHALALRRWSESHGQYRSRVIGALVEWFIFDAPESAYDEVLEIARRREARIYE